MASNWSRAIATPKSEPTRHDRNKETNAKNVPLPVHKWHIQPGPLKRAHRIALNYPSLEIYQGEYSKIKQSL